MELSIADVDRLARCLRVLTEGLNDEARAALGFLIRNLIERDGLCAADICSRLNSLSGGAIDGAFSANASDRADPAYCRAMAALCQAMAGGLPDPTAGATAVHRHTESPGWSEAAVATALVGPWVFYRLR